MNNESVSKPRLGVKDYQIHPLCALLPEMPAEEYAKLKEDIKAHGLLEPITLSADSTTVLDGRHRLRICRELGIPPRLERFEGRCTESEYIWARGLLRRHLTDDQRAMLASKWSDAERQAAQERQKSGVKPSGEVAQTYGRTRDALAEKAQVSTNKIRQAEEVKKSPELAGKVERGAMPLKEAVKVIAAQKPKTEKRSAPVARDMPTVFRQELEELVGKRINLKHTVDARLCTRIMHEEADKIEEFLKEYERGEREQKGVVLNLVEVHR